MDTAAKKFFAGLTGFAMTVPMSIGVAFAAENDIADSAVPTQACVDARAAADDASIAAKTTQTAAEIAAIRAHKAAIVAAAALTENTAKKAAFKKAETDFRMAMKAAMDASRTATRASMNAVKEACERAMKNEKMMQGREKGKKGFLNKMMKVFGRNKMMNGQSSSSSNAQ